MDESEEHVSPSLTHLINRLGSSKITHRRDGIAGVHAFLSVSHNVKMLVNISQSSSGSGGVWLSLIRNLVIAMEKEVHTLTKRYRDENGRMTTKVETGINKAAELGQLGRQSMIICIPYLHKHSIKLIVQHVLEAFESSEVCWQAFGLHYCKVLHSIVSCSSRIDDLSKKYWRRLSELCIYGLSRKWEAPGSLVGNLEIIHSELTSILQFLVKGGTGENVFGLVEAIMTLSLEYCKHLPSRRDCIKDILCILHDVLLEWSIECYPDIVENLPRLINVCIKYLRINSVQLQCIAAKVYMLCLKLILSQRGAVPRDILDNCESAVRLFIDDSKALGAGDNLTLLINVWSTYTLPWYISTERIYKMVTDYSLESKFMPLNAQAYAIHLLVSSKSMAKSIATEANDTNNMADDEVEGGVELGITRKRKRPKHATGVSGEEPFMEDISEICDHIRDYQSAVELMWILLLLYPDSIAYRTWKTWLDKMLYVSSRQEGRGGEWDVGVICLLLNHKNLDILDSSVQQALLKERLVPLVIEAIKKGVAMSYNLALLLLYRFEWSRLLLNQMLKSVGSALSMTGLKYTWAGFRLALIVISQHTSDSHGYVPMHNVSKFIYKFALSERALVEDRDSFPHDQRQFYLSYNTMVKSKAEPKSTKSTHFLLSKSDCYQADYLLSYIHGYNPKGSVSNLIAMINGSHDHSRNQRHNFRFDLCHLGIFDIQLDTNQIRELDSQLNILVASSTEDNDQKLKVALFYIKRGMLSVAKNDSTHTQMLDICTTAAQNIYTCESSIKGISLSADIFDGFWPKELGTAKVLVKQLLKWTLRGLLGAPSMIAHASDRLDNYPKGLQANDYVVKVLDIPFLSKAIHVLRNQSDIEITCVALGDILMQCPELIESASDNIISYINEIDKPLNVLTHASSLTTLAVRICSHSPKLLINLIGYLLQTVAEKCPTSMTAIYILTDILARSLGLIDKTDDNMNNFEEPLLQFVGWLIAVQGEGRLPWMLEYKFLDLAMVCAHTPWLDESIKSVLECDIYDIVRSLSRNGSHIYVRVSSEEILYREPETFFEKFDHNVNEESENSAHSLTIVSRLIGVTGAIIKHGCKFTRLIYYLIKTLSGYNSKWVRWFIRSLLKSVNEHFGFDSLGDMLNQAASSQVKCHPEILQNTQLLKDIGINDPIELEAPVSHVLVSRYLLKGQLAEANKLTERLRKSSYIVNRCNVAAHILLHLSVHPNDSQCFHGLEEWINIHYNPSGSRENFIQESGADIMTEVLLIPTLWPDSGVIENIRDLSSHLTGVDKNLAIIYSAQNLYPHLRNSIPLDQSFESSYTLEDKLYAIVSIAERVRNGSNGHFINIGSIWSILHKLVNTFKSTKFRDERLCILDGITALLACTPPDFWKSLIFPKSLTVLLASEIGDEALSEYCYALIGAIWDFVEQVSCDPVQTRRIYRESIGFVVGCYLRSEPKSISIKNCSKSFRKFLHKEKRRWVEQANVQTGGPSILAPPLPIEWYEEMDLPNFHPTFIDNETGELIVEMRILAYDSSIFLDIHPYRAIAIKYIRYALILFVDHDFGVENKLLRERIQQSLVSTTGELGDDDYDNVFKRECFMTLKILDRIIKPDDKIRQMPPTGLWHMLYKTTLSDNPNVIGVLSQVLPLCGYDDAESSKSHRWEGHIVLQFSQICRAEIPGPPSMPGALPKISVLDTAFASLVIDQENLPLNSQLITLSASFLNIDDSMSATFGSLVTMCPEIVSGILPFVIYQSISLVGANDRKAIAKNINMLLKVLRDKKSPLLYPLIQAIVKMRANIYIWLPEDGNGVSNRNVSEKLDNPHSYNSFLPIDWKMVAGIANNLNMEKEALMLYEISFTCLDTDKYCVPRSLEQKDQVNYLDTLLHLNDIAGYEAIKEAHDRNGIIDRFRAASEWSNVLFYGESRAGLGDPTLGYENESGINTFASSLNHLGYWNTSASLFGASSEKSYSVSYSAAWRLGKWDLPHDPPSVRIADKHLESPTEGLFSESCSNIERDLPIYHFMSFRSRGLYKSAAAQLNSALTDGKERYKCAFKNHDPNLQQSRSIGELYWQNSPLLLFGSLAESTALDDCLEVSRIYSEFWRSYETAPFDKVEPISLAWIQYLAICINLEKAKNDNNINLRNRLNEYMLGVIRFCKEARRNGRLQISMNMIMTAERMLKSTQIPVEHMLAQLLIEEARTLRQHGAKSAALSMLDNATGLYVPVIDQSTSMGQDSQIKYEEVVIEMLCQAGEWCAADRTLRPETIRNNYFLEAANRARKGRILEKPELGAKAYYSLAQFSETQLGYFVKLKNDESATSVQSHKRDELLEVERQLKHGSGKGSKQEKQLQNMRMRLKQVVEMDEAERKKIIQDIDHYLQLAVQGYIRALRLTEEFDDCIYNLVALWLSNSDNDIVSQVLKISSVDKIPGHKFINVLPQISAHLSTSSTAFQNVLTAIIKNVLIVYPYHSLYQIFALKNASGESTYRSGRNQRGTVGAAGLLKRHSSEDTVQSQLDIKEQGRFEKATQLLEEVYNHSQQHKKVVGVIEALCLAYIELARHPVPEKYKEPSKKKSGDRKVPIESRLQISRLEKLEDIPIITQELVIGSASTLTTTTKVAFIASVDKYYDLVGGINLPKVLKCTDSKGLVHKQLVKDNDDLRQDAVIQQLFKVMSNMLCGGPGVAGCQNKAGIRTYRVVPLTKRSGVVQWVKNTIPIGNWIENAKKAYTPQALSTKQCFQLIKDSEKKKSLEDRTKVFNEVDKRTPPTMRYFFFERFLEPEAWFISRTNYILSVANSSMAGWILGVGDRHCQNILLDQGTGEVVHIDLGISFEFGKLLPIPELVPFRLTKEIIDGMGYIGVNGEFKKSAQSTLTTLRNNSKTLETLLSVLKFDPLYRWTISVLNQQKINLRHNQLYDIGPYKDPDSVQGRIDLFASGKPSARAESNITNKDAERAIISVINKLKMDISSEGQVNELIQEATDPANLKKGLSQYQYTEVNIHNIRSLLMPIKRLISKAEYISIDTEFTGLYLTHLFDGEFGFNRYEWNTLAGHIGERYNAMKKVASTHGILSMGISLFEKVGDEEYSVHNFELLTGCQSSHMTNYQTLNFLAKNKFNFNHWAQHAIPYNIAPNPEDSQDIRAKSDKYSDCIRDIFMSILVAKKPLITHNGFVDLCYIYHHFYAPLPNDLPTFMADIYDMFPAGVWDTKYFHEHADGFNDIESTFLEYIYTKAKMDSLSKSDEGKAPLKVCVQGTLDWDGADSDKQRTYHVKGVNGYCENYAIRGKCRFEGDCPYSHNLDFIVQCREGSKKRRRSDSNTSSSSSSSSSISVTSYTNIEEPNNNHVVSNTSSDSSHSAAYDAYMTAFIFVSMIHSSGKEVVMDKDHKNQLNLARKEFPLKMIKTGTNFTSKFHQIKQFEILKK
ncbi:Serine/threonine-protein kinase tel1 [Mycoemilia scoparia]|uniref:Serine/threonine-protein kinase TEL1 n=1 Tax=Mycoemilia scoparia TaxID=417184 RepID=A0A9W8A9E9_9FUNG|nr:Serine/threonine-protein kinase tel1 [Mycoemilia scoparia]